MKLLNQLINVWLRHKGDARTKIALRLLISGVALVGGSSISVLISYNNKSNQTFNLMIDIGATEWVILILGMAVLAPGIFLSINRYFSLKKESLIKDIGLFFIPGFNNQNEEIPIKSLLKNEQQKIFPVQIKKIDSYNPKLILEEYPFIKKLINERVHHKEIKQAYVAALGSVPYLYICGTMFNNGHLPLTVLEHFRREDKWKRLDNVGSPVQLKYNFNQYKGNEAIQKLKPNSLNEIGLSISFTNEVNSTELPVALQEHTIDISLDDEYRFNAIPSDPIQDEIIEKVHHIISTLAKKSDSIHLFICAQASIVFKLGKWYQKGMYGKIVIHNYDAPNKLYNWALEFDGKNLSEKKLLLN